MAVPAKKVGYLTDVEGNWDYFQNYIKLSTIIEYDAHNNLIFKQDNTLFVFGGDVCDKGTGSIRITKQLVAFKRKYPDRVFLIMGNRDINKMRWTSELEKTEIDNVDRVPGPYWVKKESQVTPKQFLTKLVDQLYQAKQAEQKQVPTKSALFKIMNTIPNRIKWMLEATMGAAGDFDRRREELAIIQNKKPSSISDEQVAESYMASVRPGGEHFEFLSLGQLAYIHDGTLYVHGGVTKDNIGYVPFSKDTYNNIDEWVTNLNQWYKLELLEWSTKPRWDYQKKGILSIFPWGDKFEPSIQGIPGQESFEDRSKWAGRGGHRLMDYVLPTAKGSVIYSNMFNKLYNCCKVDPDVKKKLTEHGIFRVVTGHQPHGCAPAVNKADEDFETIDSDSSYSDMTAPDNRGKAVSEVVVAGRKVFVKGILHDGQAIEYMLSMDRGEGDQYIGKRVPMPDDKDENSFWVKAKLATMPKDEKEYLVCKVSGFVVSYDYMSKAKLDEIIFGRKIVYDKEDVCTITVNGKEVPITKLESVNARLSEIISVPFFEDWLHKIQSDPDLELKSIQIQSIDLTGFRIRFIKLFADLTNKKGEKVSGVIFLRGPSVAVFCVLKQDEDGKKFVVFVRHARAPIGTASHLEIPIGMEEHRSPLGVIRNLLETESGIELENDTAVNLSHYLFGDEHRAIFVSPGSCDQGVRFFLIEKFVSRALVEDIRSKFVDEASQYITVLIPLEQLEQACNDGNAIIAARLYDLYLKKKEIEKANQTPTPSPQISPIISASLTTSTSPDIMAALTISAPVKSSATPTTTTTTTTTTGDVPAVPAGSLAPPTSIAAVGRTKSTPDLQK